MKPFGILGSLPEGTPPINEQTHLISSGIVQSSPPPNRQNSQNNLPVAPGSIAFIMIASLMILFAMTARGLAVRGTKPSVVMASLSNHDLEADLVTKQPDDETSASSPFKISIWLMPPPGVETRIQGLVNSLAKKNGGPTFRPHVTVVGGFECKSEEEAHRMAADLRKGLKHYGSVPCIFDPKFKSYPTTWNQSLIATVEVTEAFFNLCQISREILNVNPNNWTFPSPANLPHMSLFYGVENIPDLTGLSPIEDYEAHTISVWKTFSSDIGGVDEWVELDSFSLE